MLNWPHSQAKLIRKNKMYDSFEWANASVEQTKSQKDYERLHLFQAPATK